MYKDLGNFIRRTSDNAFIPKDESNYDFRVVLEWLAEGNSFETDVPTPIDLRVSLKASLAKKRWEVETGGITLPSGVHLDTQAEDQNKISNSIAGMEEEGIESVDFKAASGFVTLTLAEMKALRGAIARHVQACYSNERLHSDAIDAPDCDLANYDINTGWPAN